MSSSDTFSLIKKASDLASKGYEIDLSALDCYAFDLYVQLAAAGKPSRKTIDNLTITFGGDWLSLTRKDIPPTVDETMRVLKAFCVFDFNPQVRCESGWVERYAVERCFFDTSEEHIEAIRKKSIDAIQAALDRLYGRRAKIKQLRQKFLMEAYHGDTTG